MGSGTREPFDNPVIEWVDSRLPVFTLMQKEYGVFPTPKNFNYFWNFGAIAMVMLILMIVTGITLAMHYAADTTVAFDKVERIMRDVNFGWLLRYMHMNGASFFFIAVYIHIFRGLYYGSYKAPRELLWMLGVLILLLMMATAFMGYVLPWGQMSFWGATVITNLFSALPLVGPGIVEWLWGGFAVDNPTLNRFFALHYLLPFVIVAVVFLHVWALHVTGSNNPSGIEPKGPQDTIPFNPYYTMKDTFGLLIFLIVYCVFTFFMPNALGHPDNYIEADPLVTPAHIVPEWYFLPFYAILRAINFDMNIWLLLGAAIAAYLVVINLWYMKKPEHCPIAKKLDLPILKDMPLSSLEPLMAGAAVLLLGIGALVAFFPGMGMVSMMKPLAPVLVEAKLGGVLAMFGSIAMLFVLPFIDRHEHRSARFRPWFKLAVLALVVDFFILTYVGGKPAEGLYVLVAQAATGYYFAFFLVIIPFLNKYEPRQTLPPSIHQAVLDQNMKKAKATPIVLALLAGLFLTAAPSTAHAAGGGEKPPHQSWHFNGPFGTYDRAALQRGFQVYRQVCASCHSMKLLSYRNLEDLGYDESQVKAIAQEYTVIDGPNDEGEMFERPGLPSDRFVSPYPNDAAAKYANGGAFPPDMSLLAKARPHGPDYIYALLTGYVDKAEGEHGDGHGDICAEVPEGKYCNTYFPGHAISMAPPLSDGLVAYEDGTDMTASQYAKDVSEFLMWTAEPKMEHRKQTGIMAILFLAAFAFVMYKVKRKVWSDLH